MEKSVELIRPFGMNERAFCSQLCFLYLFTLTKVIVYADRKFGKYIPILPCGVLKIILCNHDSKAYNIYNPQTIFRTS